MASSTTDGSRNRLWKTYEHTQKERENERNDFNINKFNLKILHLITSILFLTLDNAWVYILEDVIISSLAPLWAAHKSGAI